MVVEASEEEEEKEEEEEESLVEVEGKGEVLQFVLMNDRPFHRCYSWRRIRFFSPFVSFYQP